TVDGGQHADTIDVQAGALGIYHGEGGADTINIADVTIANTDILGDNGNDIINMNGTVSAAILLNGGADNDTFNLFVNFNSNVSINGGADSDTLALSGDYSGGTTLSSSKILGLEHITLGTGYSYNLTVTGDLTGGGQLTINGSALTDSSDTMTL